MSNIPEQGRMRQATLKGIKRALAKDPDSKFLQKAVQELTDMINGNSESRDSATLYAGRPMS